MMFIMCLLSSVSDESLSLWSLWLSLWFNNIYYLLMEFNFVISIQSKQMQTNTRATAKATKQIKKAKAKGERRCSKGLKIKLMKWNEFNSIELKEENDGKNVIKWTKFHKFTEVLITCNDFIDKKYFIMIYRKTHTHTHTHPHRPTYNYRHHHAQKLLSLLLSSVIRVAKWLWKVNKIQIKWELSHKWRWHLNKTNEIE